MRAVQAFPVTGAIALVAMGASLAATVGLGGAGWIVGIACGVVMIVALARGALRYGHYRLGPADWVTLVRATFAVGVATLVADSFDVSAHVALLVTLAAVALVLDSVDGWVARRSRTASALGAKVRRRGRRVPDPRPQHLRRPLGRRLGPLDRRRALRVLRGRLVVAMDAGGLPPRYWRKVVAAIQGIVLTIAAADFLPSPLTKAGLVGALRSSGSPSAGTCGGSGLTGMSTSPLSTALGHARAAIGAGLTIAALLFVWVALVAPERPGLLSLGSLVRLPLEGLVVIALALAVPAGLRRVLAWIVGPLLGLLVIVKVLDLGLYVAFDRPFDPIADWRYTGIGIETLRDSVGSRDAYVAVAGASILIVSILVLTSLAVRRLIRVAADHRRNALQAVVGLGAVWLLCWAFGAQLVSQVPVASTSAAGLAVDEVVAVRAGIRDRAVFADEVSRDRYRATPGNQLLAGLRGKDVVLAFVESYGQVAVEGPSIRRASTRCSTTGRRSCSAAGYTARSAWLTSPTFGGAAGWPTPRCSRGSGSTASGATTGSSRATAATLSQAFARAGWRTVDVLPSNARRLAARAGLLRLRPGLRPAQPRVRRARRSASRRCPTSTPCPRSTGSSSRGPTARRSWRRSTWPRATGRGRRSRRRSTGALGDGSVFDGIRADAVTAALWSDRADVRAAYRPSIAYSLNACSRSCSATPTTTSWSSCWATTSPRRSSAAPAATTTCPSPSIARDPAVLDQIAGWGWHAGLRPRPEAPVWPMGAFRDRFLSAFSAR